MDAVGQIEARITRDMLEQERYEHGVVAFGEIREGLAERARVDVAEIGRRLHAGDDERRIRIRATSADQDRVEVRAHLPDRQPAQAVVRAQLDHQHLDR
jgi:hypothetical protein